MLVEMYRVCIGGGVELIYIVMLFNITYIIKLDVEVLSGHDL